MTGLIVTVMCWRRGEGRHMDRSIQLMRWPTGWMGSRCCGWFPCRSTCCVYRPPESWLRVHRDRIIWPTLWEGWNRWQSVSIHWSLCRCHPCNRCIGRRSVGSDPWKGPVRLMPGCRFHGSPVIFVWRTSCRSSECFGSFSFESRAAAHIAFAVFPVTWIEMIGRRTWSFGGFRRTMSRRRRSVRWRCTFQNSTTCTWFL